MMTKVRVGIIGLGWGQLVLEAFRRVRSAEVVAVCDVDAARIDDVAKKYKIEKTFADYRDLIASRLVDLVVVATAPETHAAFARDVIDAGKHLLIEPPLALNIDAARSLLARAESKKILHAVDFEMRNLPALAYCKELIDEEYLGTLLRVDATLTVEHPWGLRGGWVADDARGGGILGELGAHFIDILRWWFGDVSSVFASRRTHFPTFRVPIAKPTKEAKFETRTATSDDAFWCAMQFARGGEALVNFMTGARHDLGWTISAYGSKGSLVVNSGQLVGMRDGDREMAILPIPKRLELGDNPRDPLLWGTVKLAEHVCAKIQGEHDRPAFPDFHDSIASLQIVHALRRASETRGWVEVTAPISNR
jgi:predicted dehydrogenase